MKLRAHSGFVAVTIFFLVPFIGHAQLSTATDDSREVWYDATVGVENSGIVNGPEYFMAFASTSSFPFFLTREASTGDIVFADQVYRQVPLSFDCFRGLVVLTLRKPNNFYDLIQLDTGRISSFTVHGHRFKKFVSTREAKVPGGTGYFDVLFDSENISLLARRSKVRGISQTTRKVEYETYDIVYFKQQNRWSAYTGKGTLSGLVNDKKQLQEFVRSSGIVTKNASDSDLARVAKFLSENPTLLK